MATQYDTLWPVSYADQKNYADFLLSRAKILYARRTPITVNKYTQPTQGDWENAYVTETGLPLPIPVGVKLFWRSLYTGKVLQFGTINDSVNGTVSTGEVFNLLDMDYAQPSFRFLGYMNNQRQMLHHYVSNSKNLLVPVLSYMPNGSFVYGISNFHLYDWMLEGLESLLIITRVRTVDLLAAPPSTLRLLWNRGRTTFPNLWSLDGGPTNDSMESAYLKMLGNTAVMASLGTPTSTVASDEVPIAGTLNGSDSNANTHSYGQMWIENIGQQLETSLSFPMPRENYHNPIGFARTTWLGATITDANSAISWGMFVKEDQSVGFAGLPDHSLAIQSGGYGTALHSAKVWVYGVFKSLTGELNV